MNNEWMNGWTTSSGTALRWRSVREQNVDNEKLHKREQNRNATTAANVNQKIHIARAV